MNRSVRDDVGALSFRWVMPIDSAMRARAGIANSSKMGEMNQLTAPGRASDQRLVLASTSPRRRQLLGERGFTFEVFDPAVDEESVVIPDPAELAAHLAREKARAVAASCGPAFVVGADTVVAVDDESLGKAEDDEHAREILRRLSGRTHLVVTGHCVVRTADGAEIGGVTRTLVSMRELPDSEIDEYVASEEWLGKAGAYGIQGAARRFISGLDGPFDNVVGLHVDAIVRALQDLGFEAARTSGRPR